jgi:hypothetical protein
LKTYDRKSLEGKIYFRTLLIGSIIISSIFFPILISIPLIHKSIGIVFVFTLALFIASFISFILFSDLITHKIWLKKVKPTSIYATSQYNFNARNYKGKVRNIKVIETNEYRIMESYNTPYDVTFYVVEMDDGYYTLMCSGGPNFYTKDIHSYFVGSLEKKLLIEKNKKYFLEGTLQIARGYNGRMYNQQIYIEDYFIPLPE